jgi:cell division protein FtsN
MSDRERAADERLRKQAEAAGKPYTPGRGLNPVRHAMFDHAAQYPLEQMLEIEKRRADERVRAAARSKQPGPQYLLRTAEFTDEEQAVDAITTLVDLGYDGTLVTGERNGQLLYEIRVGPYGSLEDAQQAARALERAQGISSTIEVQVPVENPEP